MKVLHVVSMIARDGSYGGPAQVALSQVAGLIAAGHDVTVVAGSKGYAFGTQVISGAKARLFPVKHVLGGGFAAQYSRPLRKWIADNSADFDLVHIHLARDLTTAPAALTIRRRGVPYVLQAHGMIAPTSRLPLKMFDAAVTRPLFDGAAEVFALNETEERDIRQLFGGSSQVSTLRNGIATPLTSSTSASHGTEVLFLARVSERKQPDVFVAAATALAPRFPHVRFTLVGHDDGTVPGLQELVDQRGLASQIVFEGGIEPSSVVDRMRRASIYVLPARDEPFGLTILEAMAAGLPVIVARSAVLASMIEAEHAGLVFEEGPGHLADAIARLLDNPAGRRDMGIAGKDAVERRYGMEPIIEALSESYSRVLRRN